jgi:hypothetical protein
MVDHSVQVLQIRTSLISGEHKPQRFSSLNCPIQKKEKKILPRLRKTVDMLKNQGLSIKISSDWKPMSYIFVDYSLLPL